MKSNRRDFLRAAGITLALPSFEAFSAVSSSPRRLVTIANPLGMIPDGFFPEKEGALGSLPYLLKPLEKHRDQISIFSNLDHGVSGGHSATHSFLSGIRDVEAGQWPDRNFSLDQKAAETVGGATRFPSMVLSAGGLARGEQELRLSWTRNGINVPPLTTTRAFFDALFKADDPAQLARRAKSYRLHDSILDSVNSQAKQLEKRLGKTDREKLDEYFTSIRETERKLELSETWIHQPKPKPGIGMPQDATIQETLPAFLDLIVLALQTDSTRVATLGIPSTLRTSDLNLSGSYHGFSHHGQDEILKKGLTVIETFQMQAVGRFLSQLQSTKDSAGRALIDTTTVLFGSGLGNGSSHSNKNLPILVAGGGMKSHGKHIVSPAESSRRIPLCNLFTTLLQQFGAEVDQFNRATGNMNELI